MKRFPVVSYDNGNIQLFEEVEDAKRAANGYNSIYGPNCARVFICGDGVSFIPEEVSLDAQEATP